MFPKMPVSDYEAGRGRFTLVRVRLNSGGYDHRGVYFGVDQPLYHFEHVENYMISGRLRANNREDAMRKVRLDYPEARFYGEKKANARSTNKD
jgi:hypothetical protein